MNRSWTIVTLVVVAACAATSLGVHGCQRHAEQMEAVLDSALKQNRNYIPFTSDSTMKEVVEYFDHPLHFWTTANDRLHGLTRQAAQVCTNGCIALNGRPRAAGEADHGGRGHHSRIGAHPWAGSCRDDGHGLLLLPP